VRDRLLDVNVRPGAHRRDRDQRVPVVGRRVDDDLRLFALEQLAVVAVGLGRVARQLRDRVGALLQLALVDVAQRDDLHPAIFQRVGQNVRPPPPRADEGEGLLFARLSAGFVRPQDGRRRPRHHDPRRRRRLQKRPSCLVHAAHDPAARADCKVFGARYTYLRVARGLHFLSSR